MPVVSVVSTQLLGVLTNLASAGVESLLAKRTLRLRVAVKAARAARAAGIGVTFRSVYNWLGRRDTRDQLNRGLATDVASAQRSLALRVTGDSEEVRSIRADVLLRMVLNEYVRCLSPSDAIALTTEWAQRELANGFAELKETIQTSESNIIDAMGPNSTFERDLGKLHPWRADEARDIATIWAGARFLVHSLTNSEARGALLRSWSETAEVVLVGAPPEAWRWLAILAADYDEHLSARTLLVAAIRRGLPNQPYWWARAALLALGDPVDEATARNYLKQSQPTHKLASIVSLIIERQYAPASTELEAWRPKDRNEAALKAALLSSSVEQLDKPNQAIAILKTALIEMPDAAGLALLASQILLRRGRSGSSEHPLSDYSEALSLALKVRDDRRRWCGDSVSAILVAIQASVLCGDVPRALRLTLELPAGESTYDELQDRRLRAQAAVLAVMSGDVERAGVLARDLGDPYIDEVVAGWRACDALQGELATRHWNEAWRVATEPMQKLQVAHLLASHGFPLPPSFNEIVDYFPVESKRLRRIEEVLSSSDDDLAVLRARAHEDVEIAVELSRRLRSLGRYRDSGEVLQQAAGRHVNPSLMKMAAGEFLEAGDYVTAEKAGRSAIELGGSSWGGRPEAMRIVFDALEAQGSTDESLSVARQLVSIEPNNQDARWVLVRCLIRIGDQRGAWAVLDYLGEPIPPRTFEEARLWLNLLILFDKSPYLVTRCLEVARGWAHQPDRFGTLLASLYWRLAQTSDEVPVDELEQLHQLTEEYTRDNPDSATFRAVQFDPDDEDPLSHIREILQAREQTDEVNALLEKVGRGELPTGIAADLAGRSHAELLITNMLRPRFSHIPDATPDFDKIITSEIALDSTAAASLATFPADLADLLYGAFTRIHSTNDTFQDALAAQESLEPRATLSTYWDRAAERVVAFEISDQDADLRARKAERMVEIMTRTTRRAWVSEQIEKLQPGKGAWLQVRDYAQARNFAFWCDDVSLRHSSNSMGVLSFGTVDLLAFLSKTSRLSAPLYEVGLATLLANYHVDLGFDSAVMELAAGFSGWKPEGAAFNFTRPYAWQDSVTASMFGVQSIEKAKAVSPEYVEGWVAAIVTGLVAIVPEDDSAASDNVAIFLGQVLQRHPTDSLILALILNGMRSGLRLRPKVKDPFEQVLRSYHRRLRRQLSATSAGSALMRLCIGLGVEDRDLAARIVLTEGL